MKTSRKILRLIPTAALLLAAFTTHGEATYNRHGKTDFRFDGETMVGAGNLIVGLRGIDGKQQWENEDSASLKKNETSDGVQVREYAGNKSIEWYRQSIKNLSDTEAEIRYQAKIRPGLSVTHLIFRVCLPATALRGIPSKSPDLTPKDGRITLQALAGAVEIDTNGSSCPVTLRDFRHEPNDQRGYLWFSPRYDAKRGAKFNVTLRVKSKIRQGDHEFLMLPLDNIANRTYADDGIPGNGRGGWTDQGINDLSFLKPGRITSAAIPFQLTGKAVILRGKQQLTTFPVQSEKLDLRGVKIERLDFLHAVAWGLPKGTEAFSYELTYADGKTVQIPVRSMVEVADWAGSARVPEARIAISGRNGVGDASLYHMMWNNPRPGSDLQSLRILANDGGSVPIVVAITAMRTNAFPDDIRRGFISIFKVPQAHKEVSTADWFECPLPWNDTIKNNSALDLSALNDAPAGKYGPLQVNSKGKFVFAGRPEEEVRFWGTNFGAAALYPSHEDADSIVRNMAKQGVNLIRMHLIATPYKSYLGPHWMLRKDGKIDPESLDRFHYLLAACRRNGIYVYLDCNNGLWYEALLQRPFRPDERAASQFDPELVATTKRFLTELFDRVNPYTGMTIAADPAIAMYEIINENSLPGLVVSDLKKRLGPYYDQLNARWQKWRNQNAPQIPGELAAGNDAKRIEFLAEVQKEHLDDMYAFLRGLGIRSPICGNNNIWVPADLAVAERMDFTNDHFYFGYSSYADQNAIPLNNECIVRTPAKSYPMTRRLNNFKLKGKPIVAGEWNFCFPNDYRSEGLPLCTAYSLFQGHDALLFFCSTGSFDCGLWERFRKNPGIMPHSQQTDPSTWGLTQACALAFRRGDIAPGTKKLTIRYTPEQLYSITDHNMLTSSKYSGLAGLYRIENTVERDAPPQPDWSKIIGKIADDYIENDTGELRRFPQDGLLLVDTTRTKMAVGALNKLDNGKRRLQDVLIESTSEFGTLTLSSLDGKPIAQSNRLLLCLVGNSRNHDTVIENNVMTRWGTSGVVITEPLNARITLDRSVVGPLSVYRLNPLTGQREGELTVTHDSSRDSFAIDHTAKTIYFELVR